MIRSLEIKLKICGDDEVEERNVVHLQNGFHVSHSGLLAIILLLSSKADDVYL